MRFHASGIVRAWRRLSLAKKIVVLAFAGSAVVVVSFAALAIWSLDQSTQRTLQERLVLATAAADSVDHYNNLVLQQLNALSVELEGPVARGDTAETNALLKTSGDLPLVMFKDMGAADAKGTVIGFYPSQGQQGSPSIEGYGGVGPLLSGSGLKQYISGIVPSMVDGKPSVVYAVSVPGTDGQVAGVLWGEVDLETSQIGGFISAIKLGKTGYAQVVDGKGNLIASTQPEQVFGNVDYGDHFVSLIQAKKTVVSTCHNCHETSAASATASPISRRKDILAFAPLTTASWGVAVRQSEGEALADTTRLREGMLIVGALALAVAFPGSIAIASRAVRPVLSLTEASKRMAAGDLSTGIPPMGEDEIGILGENLEQMRQRLRESRDELEQRRKEAESLYDISLDISSVLDTDRILASVVGDARALLSADLAILMLRNHSGQLYVRAMNGNVTEGLGGISLAPGQGFAGAVVQRAYPLSCEDYSNDDTCVHDKSVDAAVSQEGLRSLLGVPLRFGAEVLGALVVARRQVRAFSKQETFLLARFGNQASIAITNANLYQEVRRKEHLRGQLLEKVISAQEEERKRIARELHDEPAQIFSGLAMQLEAMATELPASEAPVKSRLQRLQRLATHALETVRKLMSDLRPTALDDLGLIPAIRQYAESKVGEAGVKVSVRVHDMDVRLPSRMETVIFRALQEAINNVYKHAEAKNVSILLRRDRDVIKVVVKDDGKGFTPDLSKAGSRGGLGLLGMEERVNLIGGTMKIKSHQGKGTELRIEVPLPQGEENDNG